MLPKTLPQPIAPSAKPVRQTGLAQGDASKPPRISTNTYWEKRTSGFVLTYRKRDASQPTGFRYLYLGLWPHELLWRMYAALNDNELINTLRSQANQNAKLYLERKAERNAKPRQFANA